MDMKCLFLLNVIFTSVTSDQNLSLKQVLILSRHNVRTPLAKNLSQMTPKSWPRWKEKSGYLTKKGELLEGFMGAFFAAWLNKENLLPDHCPKKEDVYVYANLKQRTKASAQAFVEKAFPNCNITVHFSKSDKIDPVFNPVIHNTSLIFKQKALDQMQERLKSLHLNSSYEDLENILDYKASEICMNDKKCDLTKDVNQIVNVIAGEKPNVLGPLKIGNSVVDAFVMENYEGFSMKNVGWGQLSNKKQWQTIMDLSRGYHDVIFNTTLIARDIAGPIIKYMSDIFLSDKLNIKMILMMGHDANIYTILKGMKFKPYHLRKQFELAPVGGKVVFQRWFDKENQKDLLKINYIYQTTEQLRNGVQLSLNNPPEFALLELDECKIDEKGFCSWNEFKKFLIRLG